MDLILTEMSRVRGPASGEDVVNGEFLRAFARRSAREREWDGKEGRESAQATLDYPAFGARLPL